jgi:hypothetical protein
MLTSSSEGCDRDGLFAAILFTAAAMVMGSRSGEERELCGAGRMNSGGSSAVNDKFLFWGLCGCRIIGEGSLIQLYLAGIS